MPGKKSVPTLLKLCETYASKIVLEFLRRHSPSTCKYCTNTSVVNEDCYDSVCLKQEISELPTCISNNLYNRIKSIADCTNNSFEYIYFQTFLFEDKDLRTNYESNGGPKDLQFVSRFSNNVTKFTSKLTRVNIKVLKKNFRVAVNLQSIEFDNLTERILEVIGKSCSQLKSIKGKFISHSNTYNSAFRKLIFNDPETQLQINKCCDTLECFDVKVEPCDAALFAQQLDILLHNVPHLRKIGVQNYLTDVIQFLNAEENRTILKLQSIWCVHLTSDMIETVNTYLPELNELRLFSEQPLNVLKGIRTISSITTLCMVNTFVTSDLYNGILYSEWRNLHTLVLLGEMGVLDLSVFARKLPCLEGLAITTCDGVIWDGKSCFTNSLKVALIEGTHFETNFSGIRSFSNTIRVLSLEMPSEHENVPVVPELLNETFPKLKSLSVTSSSAYNMDAVKDILENCPELKSFTCLLGGTTCDKYSQIADYLNENNIDCTVQ